MKKALLSLLFIPLIFTSCTNQEQQKKEEKQETKKQEVLNIYTHRFYDADQKLIKDFENQTGIKVNVKKDKASKLISLLQTEGERTKADVLVTVDAGNLGYAKKLNLLQPIESETVNNIVPLNLMDKDKHWVALTQRARVIAYDYTKVNPTKDELNSFEDLVAPKWNKQINVRSSNNIYNQSLMASMLLRLGEEKALSWAKGIVKNMAREPKGNDRDQVKQVALGEGSLAIINTYYLGKLLNSKNEMEVNAGKKVKVLFTDQNNLGAHVNISGIGISRYSANKENAIKFIEFLLSEKAQQVYAKNNYEYPVNPKVEPSELLKSWGNFKKEKIDLGKLSELNSKAIEIMEKAGWN